MAKRTPTDVTEKWRAICNEARKEMCIEKKLLGRIGGGKPPAPPKEKKAKNNGNHRTKTVSLVGY